MQIDCGAYMSSHCVCSLAGTLVMECADMAVFSIVVFVAMNSLCHVI